MRRDGGGAVERLFGRNAVAEALRGRRRLHTLYVAEGAERQERVAEMIHEAESRGVRIRRLRPPAIDQLAPGVNHQGVLLEAGPYPYVGLDQLLADTGGRTILALDHVQDVQNLGTLIRTAEATGAAGLIIPERRSAGVTPAVVNASSGAVEQLPVAQVANLSRAVDLAKEAGYWSIALDGEPPARPIYQTDLPEPALLIVGSEGKGIGPALLKRCDVVVRLPMLGRVESLNAAVAASIALYELLRRRLAPGD